MSLIGAENQLNDMRKKTRTEAEYQRVVFKGTLLITGLTMLVVILLFLVLLAYMPLPIPR